jgi:VanZ family protein
MVKRNVLSVLVALVIMYLSLTNGKKFHNVSPFEYFDKVVHFTMYFGFMLVILFENRKYLIRTNRILFVALIPLFYGILMEILQKTFASNRSEVF